MTIQEREWEQPRSVATENGGLLERTATYRNGRPWFAEEYEVLIDYARRGEDSSSVAHYLGRTRGSITSRAAKLLPPGPENKRGWRHWDNLCEQLAINPGYNWQQTLRDNGEIVISYDMIRQISSLPKNTPASIDQVMVITQADPDAASRLLSRYGHVPQTSTANVLRVKNLLPTTDHLPTRANPEGAGIDLRYSGSEPVALTSTEHHTLPTGVAVEIPYGYAGFITPCFEHSREHGITVVNSPGLIDFGYTGEVQVVLGVIGTSNTCTIEPGERIAHLTVQTVATPNIEIVEELSDSQRGDQGFHSTRSH